MKVKIELPNYSYINSEIIEELDTLFQVCSPSEIRKSLTTVFFSYLANTEPSLYKSEIREIATDFNCLIQFLQVVEKQVNVNENKDINSV